MPAYGGRGKPRPYNDLGAAILKILLWSDRVDPRPPLAFSREWRQEYFFLIETNPYSVSLSFASSYFAGPGNFLSPRHVVQSRYAHRFLASFCD
jgi:hypothetical protein